MLEPVRANPFALRYHALMSGPNQTPDNTFLAWEHVMRAPEPDDGSRTLPIFRRGATLSAQGPNTITPALHGCGSISAPNFGIELRFLCQAL